MSDSPAPETPSNSAEPAATPRRVDAVTIAAAVTALLGYGALAVHAHGAEVDATTVVVALPFLSIPGWWLLRRASVPAGRGTVVAIVLVGVALRLFFFGTEPFLSDDVYRYLWDGRVSASGVNPYGVAPEDPSLDAVEAAWPEDERIRSRVNHPNIPTIYPPALELVYRGVAECGGGLDLWRAVLLLAELALLAAVAAILRRRGRDLRELAFLWWHPLAVAENSWSAHAEAIAVTALVVAVAAMVLERRRWIGVALGVGGAAKLLPFGFVPFAWRRFGWSVPILAGVVTVLFALPFLDTDLDRAFAGLGAYAETWYFNDYLFRPLGEWIGLEPTDRKLASTAYWRRGLQVAWVVICLVAAWRGRDPVRVACAITLGFVFLTPTLHPWYLLWLLPFAALARNLGAMVLTVTVLFAYEVQIDWKAHERWEEVPLVRVFQLAPAVLFWGWAAIVARRSGEQSRE